MDTTTETAVPAAVETAPATEAKTFKSLRAEEKLLHAKLAKDLQDAKLAFEKENAVVQEAVLALAVLMFPADTLVTFRANDGKIRSGKVVKVKISSKEREVVVKIHSAIYGSVYEPPRKVRVAPADFIDPPTTVILDDEEMNGDETDEDEPDTSFDLHD